MPFAGDAYPYTVQPKEVIGQIVQSTLANWWLPLRKDSTTNADGYGSVSRGICEGGKRTNEIGSLEKKSVVKHKEMWRCTEKIAQMTP